MFTRLLHVLLVEDHPDSAIMVARLLRRKRYDVEIASSGAEALRLFAANYFDVVLCDLGLPDCDGCELLRDMLLIRPFKAIALTGYGKKEDQERSKSAGFAAHLTKPVDSCLLFRLLEHLALEAEYFPFSCEVSRSAEN